MIAIDVKNLSKTFGKRRVLKSVNLQVKKGEMVALIGASGSGKSTLIRHIACLVLCDRTREESSITVLGTPVQSRGRVTSSARQMRSRIGVIFQQFNLVSRLSLLTNVVIGVLGRIPAWRGTFGFFSDAERRLAMVALDRVGMAEYAIQRASTLSGGQQQRAAIARALVQEAEILLADEPIASLDPKAARRVMEILTDINQNDGITILVSLHQVEYAIKFCPRTIALRDGELVFDGPSTQLTPQFLNELYGSESEELFLPGLADIQAAGA